MTGDRLETAAEGILWSAQQRAEIARQRLAAARQTRDEAFAEVTAAEAAVRVAQERVDLERAAEDAASGWEDPLGRRPGDVLLGLDGREWRVSAVRRRAGYDRQRYAAEYLVEAVLPYDVARGPRWEPSAAFELN